MKSNSGKAKELSKKLRHIFGRLNAADSKSENSFKDNDNPHIKFAGRPKSSKTILHGRLVIKGFVLAFLFTLIILASLVWYTWRSNLHLKALETKYFRLLELSGQIIYFDEVLTMSAHMAVETGEPQWEDRYRIHEPLLDTAIKEVIELSPEKFLKEAIAKTDTANIKLVAMENRAFDLVRRQQLETASKLLHSTEYTKQKQVYSNGIDEISNAISSLEEARLKKEQRIALTVIALLIVTIPLVAFIWFAALRILRIYISERKRTELALRMAEQRFRAIADYTYFWEVWVSPGGNPIWTNPAVERVTGYSANELRAMRDYPMALVYEDDREKVDKAFKLALKGSTGREMEFRLIRKDGTIIWVETAWQPIFDDKGVSQGHRISIHDIVNRKQAEQALHTSEQRYRTLVENIPGIVYRCKFDEHWTMHYISEMIEKVSGYPVSDFIENQARSFVSIIHPQDRQAVKEITSEQAGKGQSFSLEYRIITSDGNIRWLFENGRGIQNENGEVLFLDGVLFDITERKHTEEAVKLSEEKFSKAFHSCPDSITISTLDDGRLVEVNEGFEHILGYSRNEILGKTSLEFNMWEKPQDRETMIELLKRQGSVHDLEIHIRNKAGQIRNCLISCEVLEIDTKPHLLAITRDITERKRAEEALRESEMMNRSLLEGSPVCNKIIDLDFKLRYMSAAGLKHLKIPDIKPYYGQPYPPKFYPDSMRAPLIKGLKIAIAGKITTVEAPVHDMEGSEVWYHTTFVPVLDDGGRVKYVIGSSVNITERKQAEQALLESEKRFRDFFKNAPIGFHIMAKDQIITDINNAELEMIGYSKKAIVGKKTWADLIVPKQRDIFKEHWNNITAKGDVRNLEYTLVHKDGHHINVILNASARFDKDGNVVNTRGSVLNITARKQSEKARQKLTRELEAKNKDLESILYAASHDLKSPLVNVQGFSYELSQSCDLIRSALTGNGQDTDMGKALATTLNEDIPKALGFIMASTKKMDSLLSGLLDVCRLNTTVIDMKEIDMNAMMSNITASMEYQLKESAAKIDIEALPPCVGDPLQINRVFTNLLTNALKSFDESRPGRIRIYGKSQNNKSIYCVEDNGIGIALEHCQKIFQMFYQHEPDKRKGEGIGLTIVRRIIDKHDGKVWVKSELGKGSKFFVSLPNA